MAFIWRRILEAFVAVDMTNVPITVGADKLAAGTIPPFVQCTFHAVPKCLYTLHRKPLGDEGNASQMRAEAAIMSTNPSVYVDIQAARLLDRHSPAIHSHN